jgi:hypothetical protein
LILNNQTELKIKIFKIDIIHVFNWLVFKTYLLIKNFFISIYIVKGFKLDGNPALIELENKLKDI